MTGGAPREILDDVIAADWRPAAAISLLSGRARWSFPSARRFTARIDSRKYRIAPDGQRLALVEGRNNIVVLDQLRAEDDVVFRMGGRGDAGSSPFWSGSVVHRESRWGMMLSSLALRAVSLAGTERVMVEPTRAALGSILDVFRDGRVLMATHAAKMGCSCLPPGQAQLRDLSWLDGSAPEALSSDGHTVPLLSEFLGGEEKMAPSTCKKRMGPMPFVLARDTAKISRRMVKWVLATEVPTRATLDHCCRQDQDRRERSPEDRSSSGNEANFLPNGRQIVFGGREKDRGPSIYVQDIESGSIRAISPENVGTRGLATSGQPVCHRLDQWAKTGQRFKYAVDDGPPIPLPYLDSNNLPLQLSPDESTLYVWRTRRVATGCRSCEHRNRQARAVENDSARRSRGRRQHHSES